MNYKQYRNLRIITAAVLAGIISHAVVFNNYILAISAVLVGMAVMFFVKKQVKDILADERDYEIAGKSARYAMGIFSVTGSVATFFFMFQREANPFYETMGSVLAYSVCGLLLLYSFIFIYFQKYAK
jgi:uncharacterized membrane protein